MHLSVSGHPLHSRALAVALTQRDDGRLDASGYLLDLRKRGFVPVAGDLQAAGIVHHMQLAGIVDPVARRLDTIAAAQPAVAFEPSALSRGESCRDPIERVAALAGTGLDAGYARQLSAAIGGPRGCSHVLTLAQLLGSSVAWALDEDARSHRAALKPGERVFRRDLIIDGHESKPGHLQLALQLTDLHFATAPAIARPLERFAAQLEVRALAHIDVAQFALVELTLSERRRTFDNIEEAPWRARADAIDGLAPLSLLSGVSAALLARFAERGDDRPLLDLLLMLAPALIQCVAALSEAWPADAKRSPSLMGTGGLPDSCYMWRRDGGLSSALKTEIKAGTVRPHRP